MLFSARAVALSVSHHFCSKVAYTASYSSRSVQPSSSDCGVLDVFRGRDMFIKGSIHFESQSHDPISCCRKSPQWGAADAENKKSHLVRTQSLNVFRLKSGVGQYIAIHATLTARNFYLAYFYPSGPFTCIFSKTSPNFFLCWLLLIPDPV